MNACRRVGGPTGLVIPAQWWAQRSPGQPGLDAAGTRVAVVLERPAQDAFAEVQAAVVFGALPLLKRGHAGFERDVNDPPEQQPSRARAHARAHACLISR